MLRERNKLSPPQTLAASALLLACATVGAAALFLSWSRLHVTNALHRFNPAATVSLESVGPTYLTFTVTGDEYNYAYLRFRNGFPVEFSK